MNVFLGCKILVLQDVDFDNGVLEVKFPTLRRFYSFFPKNNVFLGRFLLKNTIFIYRKVC